MPKSKQSNNQPAHVVRMGTIKAVIWANELKNDRTVYNVNVVRVYRDDGGEWHETNGFGRDDLLVAAKVLDLAHTWIHEQLHAQREEANAA